MASGISIPEGGILPHRIEYVEETTTGATPANPSWEMPSEWIEEFDPGFSVNYSDDAGLGEIDHYHRPLTEEPEVSMTYALQRWPTDTSGNIQSLEAYGIRRIQNLLPGSLSLGRRVEFGDPTAANSPTIDPASTINARYNPTAARDGSDSTAKTSRGYDVFKGVSVDEATLTAERGDNSAWMVETTLPAQHGRSYRIDQPTAATYLALRSTDSADTDFQVEIEDEGAATSETVALDSSDATTLVSTANQYDNIDAIQVLDPNGNVISNETADHAGDIVVAVNDGDTATPAEGEWLSVMWGFNEYGNTYGDPGVPTLGTGSHAAAISGGSEPTFYAPPNMTVERPVGEALEVTGGILSVELSVANNVERVADDGREQSQFGVMRAPELSVTADGESVAYAFAHEQSAGTGVDTRLYFNREQDEYIDVVNAVTTDTDVSDSSQELGLEREITLQAQRGPAGGDAIVMSVAGSGP